MSPTLYHPHTAHTIDVPDDAADNWRDIGWLDESPEKATDDNSEDADATRASAPKTTKTQGRNSK
ncbi:MAG: hypothetical protein Q4F65_01075 [Propionibacteriaceae bacterium]|nr:hypothetical protein [Propionibacteriaceae bacterium]